MSGPFDTRAPRQAGRFQPGVPGDGWCLRFAHRWAGQLVLPDSPKRSAGSICVLGLGKGAGGSPQVLTRAVGGVGAARLGGDERKSEKPSIAEGSKVLSFTGTAASVMDGRP